MKNSNYRRKKRVVSPVTYPQMTLSEFEMFVAIQLDDMVKSDRCIPVTENFGAKTFSSVGLRDEGHGVIVRSKDGSSFIMSIRPFEEPESKNGT